MELEEVLAHEFIDIESGCIESLLKSLWMMMMMISQRTNGQKVINAFDLNIPAGGLKFVSFVNPVAGSNKIMQVIYWVVLVRRIGLWSMLITVSS